MEHRTVVREANALDIEAITELVTQLASRVGLDDVRISAVGQRIVDDLTKPSPSSYWLAIIGDRPAGTMKVTALGPGFDTLIGMDFLATESADVARRLVMASLGEEIPVQTWIVADVDLALLESVGFELTGEEAEAPEFSLAPGIRAKKAIRR